MSQSSDPSEERERLEARLREFVGAVTGPEQLAPQPVNEAMIQHWCEAMGDANPAYLDPDVAARTVHGGVVAPPTMLQAWVLRGIEMARPPEPSANRQRELHNLLDSCGYSSVVATNCEQRYHRYLRPGDRISVQTTIESISEQKATALGVGYFINTHDVYRDQHGEEVGWMDFRVLKFKPAERPAATASEAPAAKPRRMRPPLGHDNTWWWTSIERGDLLIQRCRACGRLRHPPRPMCGSCRSTDWETQTARGRGTVYSYTIVHHPPLPGFEMPIAAATVELEEGTRLISNIVGCDPAQVHIGMPVELSIEEVEEGFKLPLFRAAAEAG
ncbi:MAG: bifunctional MaoC family dehydratase N-terminal/OB-fold nucleic acid binding domain-containing protein [Myxococcota bacterium]